MDSQTSITYESILLTVKEFLGIGLNSQERTTIEIEDGVRGNESQQNIATVSSPPDGGKRAWLIVVACAVIRFCSVMVLGLLNQSKVVCVAFDGTLLSYPAYGDIENLYNVYPGLTEQTKTTAIYEAFSDMSKIGIPLAAVLMTKFGYRIVGLVGCGMVAFGLLVSSWISCKISGLIGVFTGGVAGIGMSFIQLTSIVPVLEYFQEKRMRALISLRIGGIIGGLIIQGVAVAASKDVYWRHVYRYQLVLMILASVACVTLIPLKRKPQEYPQLAGRILGISDWNFFKNPMLYLLMVIFFFDQFGRPLPSENVQVFPMYLGDARATGFMPYVGDLIAVVGLIFWKKQTLIFVFFIMGCLDITVGLWTVQVPYLISKGWLIVYLIIFGIETGVFESVVHDIIPTLFGAENIRISVGLLHLAGGIGGIISAASDGDNYKAALKLAGAMLILAGLASFATRQFLIRRKASYTAKIVSNKIEGNNSITNVNITHDHEIEELNGEYVNTIAFNSTSQDYQNWQFHQSDTRSQNLTGTPPSQSLPVTHTSLTDDIQRVSRPTIFNNLGQQFQKRQGDNRSVGVLEPGLNVERTSSYNGFIYDNSSRLQVHQMNHNEENAETQRYTYRYSGKLDIQHDQQGDPQSSDLGRVEMEHPRYQDVERQQSYPNHGRLEHQHNQHEDRQQIELRPQHYKDEGRQSSIPDRGSMDPQRSQDGYSQPPDPGRDRIEPKPYQQEGKHSHYPNSVGMEPQRSEYEDRQQSYPNPGRMGLRGREDDDRQQAYPHRVDMRHQPLEVSVTSMGRPTIISTMQTK